MGGDSSKPKPSPITQDEPVTIAHQKFEHFREIPDQELLEITMDVPEERDVKAWEKELLGTLSGFESKEGLLLPVKYEYESKGFCGTVGTIRLQFENYPYLFSEELDNRIKMDKHFDEEELWYLLYTLVTASRDFTTVGKKVGDVRPHNIFINEDGHIKVANCYSWPYERENFEKTAFQKHTTYLSPEEMDLLEHGSTTNTTNKQLSESFSIGVTLLEATVLFEGSTLYDGVRWYPGRLAERVEELSRLEFRDEEGQWRTYSPQLKWVVSRLCQVDARERMSSGHVEEMLRAHGDEILNLRDFDKRHIPYQQVGASIRVQQVQHSQHPLPVVNGVSEQVVLMPQQKVRIAPPPQPQQPIHAYPAPAVPNNSEPFQHTQLVKSTYTYEPAPRVFQPTPTPAQVSFQPISSNPAPVPQPISRPASYQPPPVSSIPLGTTTTTTYTSQPVQYSSMLPPSTGLNNTGPSSGVRSGSGVGLPNLPNDLLSRIDQQLQQSRNQFPS